MRIYKALLRLYPSSFREEYGEELLRIFEQDRRKISSFPALLIFWIREFLDVLYNAGRVHWDILLKDLIFCRRTIIRTPGFAATAILVTALGIGANTAVFSVVNHVLIRPLPYKDSERIVRIWEKQPNYSRLEVSPPNYRDWQRQARSFESMAAYNNMVSLNLVGNGLAPERVEGAALTAGVLPLLGIRPLLGRLFTQDEDRYGAPGTVLLSYGLWKSRFGGDPRAVGKQLRFDDENFSIIGVLPANVFFPNRENQFWIPLRISPSNYEERDNYYLKVIAKLKPEVTIDQARSEMAAIAQQLEREYPKEDAKTGATVEMLRDGVPEQARMLLIALLGASVCVLLIACTNLANLFLVRAMGRQKELAVRTALGAGRQRLIRQLLTESLVFAVLGGVFGVAMAHGSLPLLTRLIPETLPIGQPTVLDVRVLVFASILLILTAVLSGVIPSLRTFSNMDVSGLHEGSRSGVGGRRERLRSALVFGEIAASVVLLIASGLLIRALWRVQAIDPGFKTENVLTMQTPLAMPKYQNTMARIDFYTRVLDPIRSLPGVHSAAYISFLPMVMRGGIWPIDSVDGIISRPGESLTASLRYITPGFFDTLRIPLRQGRDVSESDTGDAQPVAVVSESFVHRYWPNENPIGRRFTFAFNDRTIVGVVADIRVRGLERSSEPQVYLPYRQVPDGAIIFYAPRALVIRSSSDTVITLNSVRKIIQKVDPEMPVSDVLSLRDVVDSETTARRTQIRVIIAFASLSLLLAGIGLHGLLAFAVSQRTTEIGLRLALGARTKDILRVVLQRGLQVAALGTFFGLLIAYVAGRFLQAVLAGVRPSDPLTLTLACALALFTTISGCLAPALRAMRIDPATAIRTE